MKLPKMIDIIVDIVEASTAKQGRPMAIEDPVALARIRRALEAGLNDRRDPSE
jgi:hypothetical protein